MRPLNCLSASVAVWMTASGVRNSCAACPMKLALISRSFDTSIVPRCLDCSKAAPIRPQVATTSSTTDSGVAFPAVLVTVPWVVRNRVQVGCATLTTDARALWKANNPQTYDILANGGWIDDVQRIPGSPHTPEEAAALYAQTGQREHVDECAQVRFYRGLVRDFWREHPGEKARLAGQASEMLWDPQAIRTEGRTESGGLVDTLRKWAQPAYSIPLFVLGVLGVWLLPGRLALLGVAFLAYQTLDAIGFAGATRYRVPWDFLIALAAAAALWWAVDQRRRHA